MEHNEDNIYGSTRRLTRLGQGVDVSRDGAEGIHRAGLDQPDLVIMGRVLPKLDGWATTRRLKTDPVTAAIPVLAPSASAMPGDRESTREAGCQDFGSQPMDFERLRREIESVPPRDRLGKADSGRE